MLARRRQNLTIRELSQKSGIPAVTIMRMEANNRAFFHNVVKIARALGLSLDELAKEEEE